jgi:hypothetical protein
MPIPAKTVRTLKRNTLLIPCHSSKCTCVCSALTALTAWEMNESANKPGIVKSNEVFPFLLGKPKQLLTIRFQILICYSLSSTLSI